MEAGHIGRNIYLQATALGLGTVTVGAFNDERVALILGTDGNPSMSSRWVCQMISLDHNTLGYLSFALMTLTLLTGFLYLPSPRWKRKLLYLHFLHRLATYVVMFVTVWLVR